MKLPIEAVIVLLKNTIRRVFDEKLGHGIRGRSRNKFFGNLAELPFGLAVNRSRVAFWFGSRS